jgi:putative sterol carrier protein
MTGVYETRVAVRDRSDAEILAWIERVGGTSAFLEEVFSVMQDAFDAERAAGQKAVIDWEISTPDEGVVSYQVAIEDGVCRAERGRPKGPVVTLGIAMPDFLRLVVGVLDAREAAVTGRLEVSGDKILAGALRRWFPIP